MQHEGMKSHKEKASSVRLAVGRKDSILHKEKEAVEPSPSSSSEQSRTEIQCSETTQEGIKQVSIKDLFMKKTKQTGQPQMVDKKPESKDNESVLTVQEQVSKAETLWALKIVSENLSFRASDGSPELFQRMFPDSHIAQHMTMSRTKVAYMIGYGLGPYFLQKTVDDILRSPNTYYMIHMMRQQLPSQEADGCWCEILFRY